MIQFFLSRIYFRSYRVGRIDIIELYFVYCIVPYKSHEFRDNTRNNKRMLYMKFILLYRYMPHLNARWYFTCHVISLAFFISM